MLDVHPGAALVFRIEVEATEFRARCAITRPAGQPLLRVVEIPIEVQVVGEPDIVIASGTAVFHHVDVTLMVDRQIVRTGQTGTDWEARGREVEGITVREDRDVMVVMPTPF